ncbi:NAD dependent epimerase/dehydratase family protein [Nonomuraea coxensis DSM 45129]|uniref:NAD dependent epimerase/dehydratase family protein n=1 Tax=Nonomuraea coxensis DSM 45129 TaxID=1122611 RepID=A0ABX8TVG9_9ACTN|nr:NAD-dependent epimerase/dehydratase family protein [Nonomuraea coxensis]QYC38534.1 NAD dependent epimerase/dehydratase family protein [Nonomuraea coxensis DSM 45129]
MRVLVIGATGYIGAAVVERLAAGGHEVTAYVRPAADGARRVPAAAGERYGDLSDPATLRAALESGDGFDAVVHAGQLTGDRETDLAVAGVPAAAGVRMVYLSGVWVLGAVDGGDEDSPARPIPLVAYRDEVERVVLGGGGSVVRPGVVHGRGAGILVLLRDLAAERGAGVYVSAGGAAPTWPFVHVDDLAELVAAVVERGRAVVYHGVGEEAVPLTDVAEAAARAAGVKEAAEPWPVEEAAQALGTGFAEALALGQRVGAPRTRRELGWAPSRPGVVAELIEGSYA